MTTEQFAEIWQGWYLRQYLVDTCKACTGSIELQEDCLQEAALAICQENGDGTTDHYAEVGRKAIRACRQKEKREWDKAKRLRGFASYMKRGMRRG